MGPQKRLVPVSFQGGIDTKTDPKQVVSGKLLDLQNGIFLNTGALNRRWGYKALGQGIQGSSGASITSCKAIQAFNNELLLFDGGSAYSYIQATDNWASRGGVISLVQSNQQIIAGNNQQLSPDFATLGGIEVYAWEDSRGGIRYSVLDSATGAFLVVDRPLYTGALSTDIKPKCIPWQGKIFVFFGTAAGTLSFVTINPGNPSAVNSTSSVLLAQQATPVVYDAAVTANGQFLGILSQTYDPNLLAYELTYTAFRTSLSVSYSSIIAFTGPSTVVLAIAPDPINLLFWIAYIVRNGGTLYQQLVTTVIPTGSSGGPTLVPFPNALALTISQLALAPYVDPVTGGLTGTSAVVFGEYKAAQTYNQVVYQNTAYGNVHTLVPPASTPVFARSVGLASKPFVYLNNVYVNVAFQSQQQSTYFTLDASGNVVGKVFAGLCGGLIQNSDNILPECPQVSPGVFKYANLIKGVANTEAGLVLSLLGVNATKLDFAHSNNFLSAAINADLYTVGGVLQTYDGAQYVEQGFHVYPEAFTLTPSGSGGLLGTGTFVYAVTYEWTNNNDQNDISTPSLTLGTTFASGAANSVSLTIPTLRLTKKSNVKIVIYRTQANGTLLYRVTSAIAPLYNNPTVDTVTFVDTLSDASIAPNGLMYTQPLNVNAGNPVVPNSAPPACSLIATFANRVFLAGLDDPYTLWFSQPSLAGAPMQFSNLLTLRSDPDGGPITALVRLDDKLIVFKRNAIFYLTGDGPTPTGDGVTFGPLIAVPSGEVGCVSQNAVAVTPIGVLFQSANGIYLLDRALNVSYKGAPVEKFNATGISSATLIPNQWVVFTPATGDKALVYDFYFDQWSTFTNHAAIDSDLYLGSSNQLVYATAAGQVMLQTPSVFSDAGVPIQFSATLAFGSFGGLQGYQRIYHAFLLGAYKGSHTLNVWASFDFDDSFTALATIPVDATLGVNTFGSASPFGIDSPFGGVGPGQSVYQFRLDILRKCQSICLKITDQQSAPGNEGFSLSSMAFVVGVKQGGNKMPATKQFGVT